jgi:hypothetical protein
VTPRAALRADLIRALGYHLPLLVDLNPVRGLIPVGVDCTPENIVPDLEVGLPCHPRDPSTGSIAAIATIGRSWYTGADLSWRWRGDASWLSASYTWSRAEDLGSDPLRGGISLPPQSDDLSLERGPSDGDVSHRFVVAADFPLPWMGLRASGTVQLASGIPFNVTTGQDDNVDGILNDRPEGVGRNTGEHTPIGAIAGVRAAADTVYQAAGEPSLPPFGALRQPSFSQVDLGVYRPFTIGSRSGRGSVYLQVFNLLDSDNRGLVEGRAVSRFLGAPVALAGPPRTAELGLRLAY